MIIFGVTLVFYIFYLAEPKLNALITDPRTLKIYQENGQKYFGVNFLHYANQDSDQFEKKSLYIKLVPAQYNEIFSNLQEESELVLPINILTNPSYIARIEISVTLVEKNGVGEFLAPFQNIETRMLEYDSGLIESFQLPKFDLSKIKNYYIKIDINDLTNITSPNPIKLHYGAIPHGILLMKYANKLKKFVPNIKQTRSDDNFEFFLPCRRSPLYVNFTDIGWNSWIVVPRGMNIFQCMGSCNFKSSFQVEMSDNAIVRSLMLENRGISSPCCVPKKLGAVNVVVKGEEGINDYKIKKFVVDSCSCQ